VEKSPSPPALLARGDASPLPGAENRSRTGPLDAGLDHRLALAPRTQSGVLGCPCAGGVEGRGSLADLATAPGWHAVSRRRWQCQSQAGDAESVGPQGTQKRASALVFWDSLCPVDRHVGCLSPARGLSPDAAQNRSGVPNGTCRVP